MTEQASNPLPPALVGKDAFHSVPIPDPEINWPERSDQFRELQWRIAQDLLDLGQKLLGLIRQEPQSAAYLTQVHRLLEFGNALSRSTLDSAMSIPANAECRECCAHRLEMEEALDRVYGQKQAADAATPVGTLSTASPNNSSPSTTH
jgi:hypothetical protein